MLNRLIINLRLERKCTRTRAHTSLQHALLPVSLALLCLLQQLHTDPTTTCAKEAKEVLQSIVLRTADT